MDYKAAAGANLETKIDLIQFLFDSTVSAITTDIKNGVFEPEVAERLIKLIEAIDADMEDIHKSYEIILDSPALKSGINISAVSDKHNDIEMKLSKIVQKLMTFQISQDMINQSTIQEFFMLRRFGQGERE